MEILEQKILTCGTVLPGNVLKVGSFLNHQIDAVLLMELGQYVYDLFKDEGVTKIVTVEASGIAIATAFAAVFKVPMVFAKKNNTSNISDNVYSRMTHSYTHNRDYNIVIEKCYLDKNDRVLIVDDFLAKGAALESLIGIVNDSGAELVGCVPVIEKGFQGGGDLLRGRGIRVESLAIVDSMEDGKIVFRKK